MINFKKNGSFLKIKHEIVSKKESWFYSKLSDSGLKKRTISGGIQTVLSQALGFCMRLGSAIVLARMLKPEDFGLIAMVTSLTFFAERLKDFGMSAAIVQRDKINHHQLSTLFWANFFISISVMLMVVGISPFISWFYNEPKLIGITIGLSISFFFGGLSVQHQALLRRKMKFGSLSAISIFSTIGSITIGISSAWLGLGYWSLVLKEVSVSFLVAAGAWILCNWIPGRPKIDSGIGPILRFGKHVIGVDIINSLSRNVDQILIGKFWGATALGYYRQANMLIAIPTTQLLGPISYIAEPILSSLQNDADRYRKYYKEILFLLSIVLMPFATYTAIFSKEIVVYILGPKWIQSAEIFRILAISAFIAPLSSTAGFVMVTCGKSKRYLLWGVLNAIFMIVAYFCGIAWGPIGVAIAVVAFSYLSLGPSLWFSFRGTPLNLRNILRSILEPAIASFIMAIFLIWFYLLNRSLNANHLLLISIVLAITIYLGVLALIPNSRQKINIYKKYLFDYLKNKNKSLED